MVRRYEALAPTHLQSQPSLCPACGCRLWLGCCHYSSGATLRYESCCCIRYLGEGGAHRFVVYGASGVLSQQRPPRLLFRCRPPASSTVGDKLPQVCSLRTIHLYHQRNERTVRKGV